jgi:phosphoglycerate dehydrogenase-like enzyme
MTKLHCAILDDYQQIALKMADWSVLSDQVEVMSLSQHFAQQDELVNAIKDCHIVITMRERTIFNAELFARLPNLKLLITSGMRNAAIDLAAAKKHGVLVCGTKSLSEPPVELTWALILGLARHIVPENNAFCTNGPWQQTLGVDLYGKQLGLLGLGKIGSKVAQIGKAFGMHVVAWSQNLTAERAAEVGVQLAASKEELLANSDFISIHLVLSERTKNLIDKDEFNLMRPTAYLINTSRAAIVNTNALIKTLNNNEIAGAAIDVFDVEPLPINDVLRTLPNLLATPHLGYVTEGNYRIYFREAVEDIQAYLIGKLIRPL